MAKASEIREQLLKSFRAELAEHIQTMTTGLLAIEKASAGGTEAERETLDATFRAAHSLKGAARAVGVTAVEQLAHALENILNGFRQGMLSGEPEIFNACYQGLDAIQIVQAAYEAGETTPPTQVLFALANLETFRSRPGQPAPQKPPEPPRSPAPAVQAEPPPVQTSPLLNGEETIRVEVQKLDALIATLSELLIARIRIEQRQAQFAQMQDQLDDIMRGWAQVRMPAMRLFRQQENGIFSVHRPRSVDAFHSEAAPSLFLDMQRHLSAGTALPERMNAKSNPNNLVERDETLFEISKDADQLLRFVRSSQEQFQDLQTQFRDLAQQYAASTAYLSQVIETIKEDIESLRMLPFNTITASYARMVRDLAQQTGKEAVLNILGGETQVDKRILEGIKDPLTHLLRNAIDHGIEKPEVRLAKGKPASGRITIQVEQSGKALKIQLADDGGGLDLEAVRQAAAAGQDPSTLSQSELIDRLFALGVSTSQTVTQVSGRGVGLNVVRNNIEALNGRIKVDSRPGEGTVFTLTLPLSLTSMQGLLVRAGGQLFAIPIRSADRTVRLQSGDIFLFEGQDTINDEGQPLRLFHLNDALGLNGSTEGRKDLAKGVTAVILSVDERLAQQNVTGWQTQRAAFIVESLEGEQEIVMKNLGPQLKRVPGVSGATIIGNGEVVLVLDPADLIKMALRGGGSSIRETTVEQAAAAAAPTQKTILVVDDSITTRTLEKNILQAAGYQVLVAIDGNEALAIIHAGQFPHLVVTDIVMPGMNGFDLTQAIKSDPRTAHLPVILVTSLESAEDKRRGIEVQADAYIVKSSFDQDNLLDTVAQLI